MSRVRYGNWILTTAENQNVVFELSLFLSVRSVSYKWVSGRPSSSSSSIPTHSRFLPLPFWVRFSSGVLGRLHLALTDEATHRLSYLFWFYFQGFSPLSSTRWFRPRRLNSLTSFLTGNVSMETTYSIYRSNRGANFINKQPRGVLWVLQVFGCKSWRSWLRKKSFRPFNEISISCFGQRRLIVPC